jgi:hypothetical protein
MDETGGVVGVSFGTLPPGTVIADPSRFQMARPLAPQSQDDLGESVWHTNRRARPFVVELPEPMTATAQEVADALASDPRLASRHPDDPILLLAPSHRIVGLDLPRKIADATGHTVMVVEGATAQLALRNDGRAVLELERA